MHAIIDKLIVSFDLGLRTLLPPKNRATERDTPAKTINNDEPLTKSEERHVAGLMRVNHAGEVCAQALYLGQSLSAKLTNVRDKMQQAAIEETDHLAWCEKRLQELNSQTSLLNPLWFKLSVTIGALAGYCGDKWSLGFVVETERQVCEHLINHLEQLPQQDKKTAAILNQMITDEKHHAEFAKKAGGAELPVIIKVIMSYVSKLMTKTSYYI